jgi:hypothetical protein
MTSLIRRYHVTWPLSSGARSSPTSQMLGIHVIAAKSCIVRPPLRLELRKADTKRGTIKTRWLCLMTRRRRLSASSFLLHLLTCFRGSCPTVFTGFTIFSKDLGLPCMRQEPQPGALRLDNCWEWKQLYCLHNGQKRSAWWPS